MKKLVRMIVIIPVGPTTNSVFLLDTLRSIKYFCDKSHKIILVNDSQNKLDSRVFEFDIEQVETNRSMGKQAGLYFSLCKGITYALENYDFEVILRMDDDALITGPKPEIDAISYLKTHKNIGLIGSYRLAWDNSPRSFEIPKKQIIVETSVPWCIFKSIRRMRIINIQPLVKKAMRNGYELGEHVLGGAYFMSASLARSLSGSNLLPTYVFTGSMLEEDHIFGLLTHAVGMNLGDFVTGSYPMCLKLKGMPTSPKNIRKLGKKVIHSTRYFANLTEKDIRKSFQKYRR